MVLFIDVVAVAVVIGAEEVVIVGDGIVEDEFGGMKGKMVGLI